MISKKWKHSFTMSVSQLVFRQFTAWATAVGNKPRPLVVRFRTASDRESVKNNLRKLKGQIRWDRVSVCPDLTKMQCAEEKIKFKQLLEEQKCKNEESTEKGAWKIVGSRGKRQLIFKPNNP